MGLNFLSKLPINQRFKKATDDELMVLVADGDQKAFGELFERHGGKVLGFAKKMLGDLERAEEASQDIWVKVVKQAPSYQKEGYFKSWVMTMVRNHCLNIIRKDKRLSFQEDVGEHIDSEHQASFEKDLLNKYDLEIVSEAMQSLPEKQRVALTILITEELSYEELAETMNASVGAVKSMIFRARKTLQETLGPVLGKEASS